MGRNVPSGIGPFGPVRSESDILDLALAVAARHGEPNPELVEHAIGTREAATGTTGSIVHSDAPSYLIAIKGHFVAPRPAPPRHRARSGEEMLSYPVCVLLVDIESGQITDSGSGHDYPDLASLGAVVTDRQARSG